LRALLIKKCKGEPTSQREMAQMFHRVRWSKRCLTGIVHIIADHSRERGWEFAEQDGYDIQWFPLASTPELIATATSLLGEETLRESTTRHT
jgi:hypothetical protein